jgi:hypothetical protein
MGSQRLARYEINCEIKSEINKSVKNRNIAEFNLAFILHHYSPPGGVSTALIILKKVSKSAHDFLNCHVKGC